MNMELIIIIINNNKWNNQIFGTTHWCLKSTILQYFTTTVQLSLFFSFWFRLSHFRPEFRIPVCARHARGQESPSDEGDQLVPVFFDLLASALAWRHFLGTISGRSQYMQLSVFAILTCWYDCQSSVWCFGRRCLVFWKRFFHVALLYNCFQASPGELWSTLLTP